MKKVPNYKRGLLVQVRRHPAYKQFKTICIFYGLYPIDALSQAIHNWLKEPSQIAVLDEILKYNENLRQKFTEKKPSLYQVFEAVVWEKNITKKSALSMAMRDWIDQNRLPKEMR